MPHAAGRSWAAAAGDGLRRRHSVRPPRTGVSWTEEQFINKFKGFETPDGRVLSNDEQRQNTAMPWPAYAGMTREDLGAIYAFLRTVKPVTHRVDKWPDAKPTSSTR